MTAFMEVSISTDLKLYYKSLSVLESNSADTASYRHASSASNVTTNTLASADVPNYSASAGGVRPDYANSGTLVVGQLYTIVSFTAGDDFTNIGAAANATGQSFIATGTTPTTWTNGSSVALGPGLGFGSQSDGSGGYADYPFAIDAGQPDQVGGFKFSLDGVMCYIDPCTTDIQPSKVCP